MRIRAIQTIIFLTLILVSVPAHAQKVTFDWDKDVDFTPYRTYRWLDVSEGRAQVESTHKRILTNVDVQLQAKNLRKKTSDDADLYVNYQVVTDNNGQISSFNPDGKWRPGPGMSGEASKPTAGTKLKGALIVDVYDQKLKKLIWRGFVSGAFDSRQAVNYNIDKGLSKLFTYFPPPPPQ